MNFGVVLRAFDTAVILRDLARRLRGDEPPLPQAPGTDLAQSPAVQGLTGHIEARLTNVVVAALKEAFDRDHARLELERAQMEEQRRRAEEALRLEQRRQAAEREIARLRLLAGLAMVGWIGSIVLLGWRLPLAPVPARIALGIGWVLLLACIGTAVTEMGRAAERSGPSALPMWLLIAGLAVTAFTLLL